jgi:hypothetical protein
VGGARFVSYALAGDASGVICVSTVGRRTYCFDTVSRAWSKAADWALPFDGKVEHDRELGLWLGFVKQDSYVSNCEGNDISSLYATGDLFADVDRRSLVWYTGDDSRNLFSPWGWHKSKVLEPQVVSLGSGKFCVTQFFKTMREPCRKCFHEDVDKRFAMFTGVKVIRRGIKDGDEKAGDGGASVSGPTELRLIIRKSKRYVFTKGNTIEFVL